MRKISQSFALPTAAGKTTSRIQYPGAKRRKTISSASTSNLNPTLLPAGVVVFELEPTTQPSPIMGRSISSAPRAVVSNQPLGSFHQLLADNCTPPPKRIAANILSKNKNSTTAVNPVVSINQHSITPVANNFTYKVLHRTINAPINKRQAVTLEKLSSQGEPGLFKSFVEKTIQQPGNVFTSVPQPGETKKAKSSTEETVRSKLYKIALSLFNDVPGIFTLFRERPVYVVEPYYAPLEMIGEHVYFPSFLQSKTPLRTYQERPLVRSDRGTQRNLSLLGVRIESIHQVGNRVHICTVGEPQVNKESESLFGDLSALSRNPLEVANQLCVEHNYSYGETDMKENEEEEIANTSNELVEDADVSS